MMTDEDDYLYDSLWQEKKDLLAALEVAAKIINAMHTGTLPPCFRPTLEVVNQINQAIYDAQ